MSTSAAGPARYHRFLRDLLGAMAYGELSAFERLSSDARYSPTLRDRAVLGRLAVLEFQHFELVCAKLAELGEDAEDAMVPFQPPVDHFHERTRPADWYESLMKAYVIDTVSADFYRSVARYVDADTAALIGRVQVAEDATAVLRDRLKTALADDPRLASRLNLWARRLLGEALTHARRISAGPAFLDGLANAGEDPAGGLARGLAAELAAAHSRRMSRLGLAG